MIKRQNELLMAYNKINSCRPDKDSKTEWNKERSYIHVEYCFIVDEMIQVLKHEILVWNTSCYQAQSYDIDRK